MMRLSPGRQVTLDPAVIIAVLSLLGGAMATGGTIYGIRSTNRTKAAVDGKATEVASAAGRLAEQAAAVDSLVAAAERWEAFASRVEAQLTACEQRETSNRDEIDRLRIEVAAVRRGHQ